MNGVTCRGEEPGRNDHDSPAAVAPAALVVVGEASESGCLSGGGTDQERYDAVLYHRCKDDLYEEIWGVVHAARV